MMSVEKCAWCGEKHFAQPLAPPNWDCQTCERPNLTTSYGVIKANPQTHLGHHIGAVRKGRGESLNADMGAVARRIDKKSKKAEEKL